MMIDANSVFRLSRFRPSRFSSPSRRVASSAFQKCWDLIRLDVCSSRYHVDRHTGPENFRCTGATKIARWFFLVRKEIEELADVFILNRCRFLVSAM